jgi:hypothetical protein
MITGLAWTLLASVFLGTFALPGKYIKNYQWENAWGSFFFFAMLFIPLCFASIGLKGLWETYRQLPFSIIFGVVSLGFLWGCGFCLWGYGLARLGLSLGYALTMGTMALCGSMLPFFLGNADKAATSGGMVIIAGVLICIIGVAINGVAGLKREKSLLKDDPEEKKQVSPLSGVIICVLAGLLSSGCNIAFHIGGKIGKIDTISVDQFHNPSWIAGLSIWTLIFLGGFISSCGYTAIRLFRNNTWKNFIVPETGINLTLAFIMALAHFACLFFYGLGGWKLGVLGTSVGFAIFQTGSVLVGNILGFSTGEWKAASSESKRWLYIGLSTLILGIITVSAGNML